MADKETQATPPAADNRPSVQLTIGTLIVIALIVSMCSGKGEVDKIRQDTASLRHQVSEINRKLDTLIQKQGGASSADVEAAAAPPDIGTTPAQNP